MIDRAEKQRIFLTAVQILGIALIVIAILTWWVDGTLWSAVPLFVGMALIEVGS